MSFLALFVRICELCINTTVTETLSVSNGLVQDLDRPGPVVIKLFSYSTQLSMTFILLINVKMPTIFGISTFISMIITTSESLKARKICILLHSSFYEQLKFCAQLS